MQIKATIVFVRDPTFSLHHVKLFHSIRLDRQFFLKKKPYQLGELDSTSRNGAWHTNCVRPQKLFPNTNNRHAKLSGMTNQHHDACYKARLPTTRVEKYFPS
jgi:hypothetical protein